MNEIPSEMLRGHIDTIILLCLIENDMHTNQIKEEIEKRAGGDFQLKQGTFYSALQRIVKQGYVKEYRNSKTDDGVRRKFYQLTEKGKVYIDDNKDKWTYSREMINILTETPKQDKTEIPKNNVQKEPVVNKEIEEESSPEEALQEFLSANMVNEVPEEKTVKALEPEPVKEEEPVKPVKKSPKVESKQQDNYDLFKYIDLTQSEIYEEEKVTETEPVTETTNPKEEQKTDEVTPNIEEVVEKVVEKVVERVVERLPEAKEEPKKEEQMDEVAISSNDEQQQPEQNDTKIVFVETIPQQNESVQNDLIEVKKDRIAPENDDFYNGEQPITGDYKLVLSNIFDDDKPKKEKISEVVYQEGMDINRFFGEETTTVERVEPEPIIPPKKEKVKPLKQKQKPIKQREEQIETYKKQEVVKHPYYDFSDIQSMADREGFRIKVSSSDRKQDSGRILINKLLFHSSLTFFLVILVETVLIYFATKDIAQLSFMPYGIFLGIMALMPIYTAIAYIINKDKKVYKISSFKSSLELLAIIMLNLVIIEIVCCVLANLDFSNQQLVVRYVLYPILFIINLPIYLFIKYLKLDKNNYYM